MPPLPENSEKAAPAGCWNPRVATRLCSREEREPPNTSPRAVLWCNIRAMAWSIAFDVLLAILLLAATSGMAYLGFYVTLHPPPDQKWKTRYKLASGALAFLAVVIVAAETTKTGISQVEAQNTSNHLNTTISTLRSTAATEEATSRQAIAVNQAKTEGLLTGLGIKIGAIGDARSDPGLKNLAASIQAMVKSNEDVNTTKLLTNKELVSRAIQAATQMHSLYSDTETQIKR